MTDQSSIIVVMVLGCDGRDKKYKEYSKEIANKIKDLSKNLNLTIKNPVIIAAGGHTNPGKCEFTEAEAMKQTLKGRSIKATIFCEKESLDKHANLENSVKLMNSQNIRPSKVIVLCENMKFGEIRIIAKKLLSEFDYEIIGIKLERGITDRLIQILITIKDFLSFRFPIIEKMFISFRKKQLNIKNRP